METQPKCSKCEEPVPHDAPGGQCPNCLLKMADWSESDEKAEGFQPQQQPKRAPSGDLDAHAPADPARSPYLPGAD